MNRTIAFLLLAWLSLVLPVAHGQVPFIEHEPDGAAWADIMNRGDYLGVELAGGRAGPQAPLGPFRMKDDPAIRKEVMALYAEIITLLEARPVELVSPNIFNAVQKSFWLSNQVMQWRTYAEAEAELYHVIALCERQFRDASRPWAVWTALRVGKQHLIWWLRTNPVECARLMDLFSEKYAPLAEPGAREQWFFVLVEFERLLRIYGLPQHPELLARMERYMQNEAVPLSQRVSMTATMAREIYSDGEAALANKYLTEFAEAHPEALASLTFRHCWFYVSLIGLGDRARARSLIDNLEAAGVKIETAATNDAAYGMVEAYYRHLPLTDDELKRQAAEYTRTRREMKERREFP